MLDDARTAQRELLDVGRTDAETVRVGAEQCVGDLVDLPDLPDLLTSFQARNSGSELQFAQGRSDALVDRLSQDELDVALIALEAGAAVGPSSRGVTTVELRHEPFVLLLPAGHELAGHGAAEWAVLEAHPFVDFSPAWVERRIVDDAFATRRLSRRTTMTVDDVHMLIDLVRHGFGIALLPESIASKPQADGLPRRHVGPPEPSRQIHVAISDHAGPAARAFAAMLIPAATTAEVRTQVARRHRAMA